jgi:hypothetical protein
MEDTMDRKHNISHEHIAHVPCQASPTGRHRVFLGFITMAPRPRYHGDKQDADYEQLVYARCECGDASWRAADAVRRLGGQTCWSVVRDVSILLQVPQNVDNREVRYYSHGGANTVYDPDNGARAVTPNVLPVGLVEVVRDARACGHTVYNARHADDEVPDRRSVHARLLERHLSRLKTGVLWHVHEQDGGRGLFIGVVPASRYYGNRAEAQVIRHIDGIWQYDPSAGRKVAEYVGYSGERCTICSAHAEKKWRRVEQHAGGREHAESFDRVARATCLALRRLGQGGQP